MKAPRLRPMPIAVLLPGWLACASWLWPLAAHAATLGDELRVYDWPSLGYAGALGLLGGTLALIVALATERRVVLEIVLEGVRNAIVSPIAGAGCYALVKSAAALGWFTLSTEPRFLLIVAAGYAGIAAIDWARGFTRRGADAFEGWFTRGRP